MGGSMGSCSRKLKINFKLSLIYESRYLFFYLYRSPKDAQCYYVLLNIKACELLNFKFFLFICTIYCMFISKIQSFQCSQSSRVICRDCNFFIAVAEYHSICLTYKKVDSLLSMQQHYFSTTIKSRQLAAWLRKSLQKF